jgi:hypothetical protein
MTWRALSISPYYKLLLQLIHLRLELSDTPPQLLVGLVRRRILGAQAQVEIESKV